MSYNDVVNLINDTSRELTQKLSASVIIMDKPLSDALHCLGDVHNLIQTKVPPGDKERLLAVFQQHRQDLEPLITRLNRELSFLEAAVGSFPDNTEVDSIETSERSCLLDPGRNSSRYKSWFSN